MRWFTLLNWILTFFMFFVLQNLLLHYPDLNKQSDNKETQFKDKHEAIWKFFFSVSEKFQMLKH